MRETFGLISLFATIWRLINNSINKKQLKKDVKKLTDNHALREEVCQEMFFTAGKWVDDNCVNTYRSLKDKLHTFKTPKYEVLGVFDIDTDSTMLVVQCNDFDVSMTSSGNNNLSLYVRKLYFNLRKSNKESKIELRTFSYTDLNEKNLMTDFYRQCHQLVMQPQVGSMNH